MDIKKELKKNQIVLSVLDNSYYNQAILDLLHKLRGKNVCYVTLNQPSSSLKNRFKVHGIKSNIFYIDAVSQTLGKKERPPNALFVSCPAALTEISIAISESLKSKMFDIIIFDSLSTLNLSKRKREIERFTTHIMNKIKAQKSKAIFTCLEDDLHSDLIKDSCMNVDKVLKWDLGPLKHKKRNQAATALALLLGLGTFTLFSNNSITAMVTKDVPGLPSLLAWTVIGSAVLICLITYVFIRRHQQNHLGTPFPINKKSFRLRVKNKLQAWG